MMSSIYFIQILIKVLITRILELIFIRLKRKLFKINVNRLKEAKYG